MSDAPLTCPYCNAYVRLPTVGTVAFDGRIVCPRCGESFIAPPGSYANQPDTAGPTIESIRGDTPVSPRPKPRGRNRVVGLGLLALMVVMAGVGLAYALWTTDLRRIHDTGRSQSGRPLPMPTDATLLSPTGPVAPAKLDALAYLPPDTNLVVGVHLAEIGGTKAGKTLLAQSLPVGPLPAVKIDDLLRWTRFEPSEVAHLIIGFKLVKQVPGDLPLPPRMELIVHTKSAFDADTVRKRLNAHLDSEDGKRRLDRFELGNKQLSAVLWCADDRHTFVFGLVPSDVKAVPPTPEPNLDRLPRELREVLQERVASGGPLWIAGTSDDWSKTWAAKLFDKLPAADRARLNRVRTFAAWVQLDESVTVRGAFDCRDDAGAKGLEDYFHGLSKDGDPGLKMANDSGWITLQWRTTPETLLRSLEK